MLHVSSYLKVCYRLVIRLLLNTTKCYNYNIATRKYHAHKVREGLFKILRDKIWRWPEDKPKASLLMPFFVVYILPPPSIVFKPL